MILSELKSANVTLFVITFGHIKSFRREILSFDWNPCHDLIVDLIYEK